MPMRSSPDHLRKCVLRRCRRGDVLATAWRTVCVRGSRTKVREVSRSTWQCRRGAPPRAPRSPATRLRTSKSSRSNRPSRRVSRRNDRPGGSPDGRHHACWRRALATSTSTGKTLEACSAAFVRLRACRETRPRPVRPLGENQRTLSKEDFEN